MVFVPPEDRRERIRCGRRRVLAEQCEELGRQTLVDERDEADRACRAAHTQHLIGHRLVVGREHRAGGRGDDVEAPVCERELLSVTFDPFDRQAARLGLTPAGGKALRCDVQRDDLCAALGGTERDVASSRSHVEHAVSARDTARLDENRAKFPEQLLSRTCCSRRAPR